MARAHINYFINIGLGITFLTSVITGLTKWPGLFRQLGLNHRSLPMAAISAIHDWSGLAMALLVLIHLVLHWRWIVSMTRSIFARKAAEK